MAEVISVAVAGNASLAERARPLDTALAAHFPSRHVLVRCISSADHPQLEKEQLIERITETGTDRYDSTRLQVGHEFYGKWTIDFFATEVWPGRDSVFPEILKDFAVGAVEDRGHSVEIDLVLIYDPDLCEMVAGIYEGEHTSDAFVFASPARKAEALLAILVVNSRTSAAGQ